ncbi:MAG: C1 family peptidase [Flavobacteriales bacterium]|nr:MAG: C1 family peptidase [Flavobacteriales bacterium]
MVAVLALAWAPRARAQGDPRAGTALPKAEGLMRFPVVLAAPRIATASLPPRVDLSHRVPPPGDQGMTNTCAGWAVGYTLCSAIHAELSGDTALRREAPDAARLFSPSFIYARALRGRPCGSDVFLADALHVADSLGCCAFSELPFDTAQVQHDCARVPEKAEELARRFRLAGIERIADGATDAVRAALAQGRLVVVNANVDSSFTAAGDRSGGDRPFTWQPVTFADTYGHAVVIMGYDDADKSFLVQNSWGLMWGFQGTFRMPYAVYMAYVSEAYAVDATIRLIGLVPPPVQADTARQGRRRMEASLKEGEAIAHHGIVLHAVDVDPAAGTALLRLGDADDGRMLHHLRLAVGDTRTVHHEGRAYSVSRPGPSAEGEQTRLRLRARPAHRDPELRQALRRSARLAAGRRP